VTKKKGTSKASKSMAYAFQRKGGAPLTKTELNEMLRNAVENTALAHKLDEPPEDQDK
jgi:hypothetical protein